MLETIQIPILLKAIDFVFEEGRKILEERRERRKMNAKPQADEPQTPEQVFVLPPPEKAREVKQDLLTSKIDESIWQNNEAELKHLVRLLEIYSNNYHLAREQYAKWGSALVPPIVVNNMVEAENAVLETTRQLELLLSKIYKKDIK